MITLYGIKNCDSVKKARKWLELQGIEHHFHDFRDDGLSREQAQTWLTELGWEALVNRRSTTWKTLDQDQRDAMDNATALDAIIEHPTLIKRPLLDTGSGRTVGFKADEYAQLFQRHAL